MKAPVYVIGTFDTKTAELRYVASLLRAAGVTVSTVDAGTRSGGAEADIAPGQVASAHPDGALHQHLASAPQPTGAQQR